MPLNRRDIWEVNSMPKKKELDAEHTGRFILRQSWIPVQLECLILPIHHPAQKVARWSLYIEVNLQRHLYTSTPVDPLLFKPTGMTNQLL